MTKYNQLFKQQVVNFYFEHHENLTFTLKHFNLPKTTVSCWIAQYKYLGTNVLAVLHRKRIYSPEFKHSVVQTILSQHVIDVFFLMLSLQSQQYGIEHLSRRMKKIF